MVLGVAPTANQLSEFAAGDRPTADRHVWSSRQSKRLLGGSFGCFSAYAERGFRGRLGFFGKSICLDGFLMGRSVIILTVMLGGAAMRFASDIMMLGGLGVVIVGHRFSDLLSC